MGTVGALLVALSCSNQRIADDETLPPLPSLESLLPTSTTMLPGPDTSATAPGTTTKHTRTTLKPITIPSTVKPLVTTPATTNPTGPNTTTTSGSTGPTTTVATEPGGPATAVLASIPVRAEHTGKPTFKDTSFAGWTTDASKCDTAARVLIRDSTTPVKRDKKTCVIKSGTWLSAYDQVSTTNPAAIVVVQLVSLKQAWDSGAWAWTQQRRDAFANDMTDRRSLSVMTLALRTVRGDRDPASWLPPEPDQVCRYLAEWISIKARWDLTVDTAEAAAIHAVLTDQCPDLLIPDWPVVS